MADSNQKTWWDRDNIDLIPSQNISKHDRGSIAILLFAVLMFFGIIFWTIFGAAAGQAESRSGQHDATVYPATIESVLSQCGDIYTFSPERENYGVIPDNPEATVLGIPHHPMIVPVYGYMAQEDTFLDVITYPVGEFPSREEVLRAQWGGRVIIWYNANVEASILADMRVTAAEYGNVTLLEWREDYDLPLNRNIAFGAWGASQSCLQWNSASFADFMIFLAEHPEFGGQTSLPPEAIVDDEGFLSSLETSDSIRLREEIAKDRLPPGMRPQENE